LVIEKTSIQEIENKENNIMQDNFIPAEGFFKYSPQEIMFVEIFYPEYGSSFIASKTNLSKDEVISIVNTLKLHREHPMLFKDISKYIGLSESRTNAVYRQAIKKIKVIIQENNKELLEVSRWPE